VSQLAPVLKSPEPGEASQVASCACDGAAGSAQASADDVNSAARRRRVALKQSFPALTTSPSTLSRVLDRIHRIEREGCPDKRLASF